jgi:hypothetical protein
MKIGKKKLKMSSGEIRTFRSEAARDNFERIAQAVKHGWKPTGKRKKRTSDIMRTG